LDSCIKSELGKEFILSFQHQFSTFEVQCHFLIDIQKKSLNLKLH